MFLGKSSIIDLRKLLVITPAEIVSYVRNVDGVVNNIIMFC